MITKYRATQRWEFKHPQIIKVTFSSDGFRKAKTINGGNIDERNNYFESFEDAKNHLIHISNDVILHEKEIMKKINKLNIWSEL